MNWEERLQRLDDAVAQDRIIKEDWGHTEDGREMVCMLTAPYPELIEGENMAVIHELPTWFALLVPSLDDSSSERYWNDTVKLYASTMHNVEKLQPYHWFAIYLQFIYELLRTMQLNGMVSPAFNALVGKLRLSQFTPINARLSVHRSCLDQFLGDLYREERQQPYADTVWRDTSRMSVITHAVMRIKLYEHTQVVVKSTTTNDKDLIFTCFNVCRGKHNISREDCWTLVARRLFTLINEMAAKLP